VTTAAETATSGEPGGSGSADTSGTASTSAPVIGRDAELTRLRENMATGRHTLLVGPIGIGKSFLLRSIAAEIPTTLYIEHTRPLRPSLLALCRDLHRAGHLAFADLDQPAPGWSDCSKKLGRLNIRELTDVIVASIHGRGLVLALDQLEGITPSMAPSLQRLLAEATILGATARLKPGLEKFWWSFDRVDVPPLGREDARALLWRLTDAAAIGDPEMFETKVLAQAAGNPHAIVEMARQASGTPRLGVQAIRDLWHAAGVRYFDLTPWLLLLGAAFSVARFVALGLDDTDLYIIAGSLGALFLVARYFLWHSRTRD
jgi:hypothetical protein